MDIELLKNLRSYRTGLGLSQVKLSELSGVPQNILSAFELGKGGLLPDYIDALCTALNNKLNVAEVVTRKKRYRKHEYIDVKKHPERVLRATPSDGNPEYRNVLNQLYFNHIQDKLGAPSALSLFAGCGGFSLGFSAAGFAVKGFLELEPPLRKIYKSNFPSSLELGGDITKVTSNQLLEFRNQLGEIDVIICGPPCQGFSLSGKRQIDDPRNSLFKHYLRFVDVFKPKIALLENVRLLTSMKNSEGYFVKDEIRNEFRKHGYKINYFQINAVDFGVPQHRERVIFLAVRDDLSVTSSVFESIFGGEVDSVKVKKHHRTFADACSDLEFIESGGKGSDNLHKAVSHPAHVIDWLWDVPEGCSAHDNLDVNKRPPSGYNTTYKRQVWLEPGATVQTTFGMISGCRNVHPIATRSLTIREGARLQSFPDDYKFEGTSGAIRTGIGNAVPPLLAYEIAKKLKKLI